MEMTREDKLTLLARALIALPFIAAAFGGIMPWGVISNAIRSRNIPFPAFWQLVIVGVQLATGLMLLVGWKVRMAALTLSVYLVAQMLLIQPNFLTTNEQMTYQLQVAFVMRNIAVIGGLMLFVAYGGGRFSVDNIYEAFGPEAARPSRPGAPVPGERKVA